MRTPHVGSAENFTLVRKPAQNCSDSVKSAIHTKSEKLQCACKYCNAAWIDCEERIELRKSTSYSAKRKAPE